MDLWQLNILCKVIDLKSFSKAGRAIHLSQPTISSHIKDLENHFGCRLIDRLGKETLPTKEGELLYKYARRLITLKDETEIAMAEFQGVIKGHLIIGGSTIPGNYIAPKIIAQFIKQHPEVKISLIVADTDKIINDILEGDIEIGIVGAPSNDKKILQEKLIEDDMLLVIPRQHKWSSLKKVNMKMIEQEPFIIREDGSGTLKSLKKRLNEAGYSLDDLKIVAQMGSTTAVCQGIKNGLGVSILSSIAVKEEVNSGIFKLLPIKELNLKRNFYLTINKYRSMSPICNSFVDFIKNSVKAKSY